MTKYTEYPEEVNQDAIEAAVRRIRVARKDRREEFDLARVIEELAGEINRLNEYVLRVCD